MSNYYCGLQSTTLTLHYSGRQLRMNFISTVAQWDKFFVFLLYIRFFLFGKYFIFGELWYKLFQGSLIRNCVLSVTSNFHSTSSCHLVLGSWDFIIRQSCSLKYFYCWLLTLQYILIALSKQIKFKSSAVRNLLFTIRLTRDFPDFAIVRCCTTPKTSVFPYLLLFYWEFEPCCLQHAF